MSEPIMFYGFDVVEYDPHHEEPPEPFGCWFGHADVSPGETIRLRWLDGSKAYDVRVFGRSDRTLHVYPMDEWQEFCDLWRNIYAHKETYGDPPGYRKAIEFMAKGFIR